MLNTVHQSGAVAKITGFQGDVFLRSNGKLVSVKPNTVIFVDDILETKGASAVLVSLENGLTFSLGHDQTQIISKEFLQTLFGDAESAIDEGVNFAAIEKSLEEGKTLEEILPDTEAGEDPSSSFADGEYYRLDLNLAELVPQSGFDTNPLLGSSPSDFERPINFLPDAPPPVIDVNNTPVAANIDLQQVLEDAPSSINLAQYFSDADENQSLIYEISALPEGLVFNSVTGVISGAATNTAALTDNGNYQVTISAQDDSGAENSRVTTEFNLQVINVNDAPELSSINLGSLNEDNSIVITSDILLANATDIDSTAIDVDSLILAEGSGNLRLENGGYIFTPTENWYGEVRFVNTVSDGDGGVASADVALSVLPVNDRPVAEQIGPQQVFEDTPSVIDLSSFFSDVDAGQTLTFQVNGGRCIF